MLGSLVFVAVILLSSFNLYYFSCVLLLCFPLQSFHCYCLHFALSNGISDLFWRLHFGSGVPYGLRTSSQSPEATVSGEPEAKEPETQWLTWPFRSGAAVVHHCAFILITLIIHRTDIVPLKSSFKTWTIESAVDFFFPALSRCDKSALGMAFLLCYPKSIRVLFPIWHRNKAVHFVCLVSKSSFLCFILLKLLGGAANTVWAGYHSIHKGRFEVPPRSSFKDIYFFTVVIRHHKESNQIVGSFTYNK